MDTAKANKPLIDIALIKAPARGAETIYGLTLLERAITNCHRAGVNRIYIENAHATARQDEMSAALGRFAGKPGVTIVDSFAELAASHNLAPGTPCLMLTGNLVFTASQLRKLVADSAGRSSDVVTLPAYSSEDDSIMAGPINRVVDPADARGRVGRANQANRYLPFALNGKPEDADEAEVRLAKALRFETVETDGILARLIDRRVSWRISRQLARLGASPNGITICNTFIGFLCASLFVSTSYWSRIAGALLFLVAVTIDGVDGEVARLRMVESKFGALLDRITDNIVHVAVFIGLMVGCYRISGSTAYFYLLGILLVGFGACAISVQRALRVRGDEAQEWLSKVERFSGRDFAYLLVVLAVINHLAIFCWGTAFGTWVFALVLWWLTDRRSETGEHQARPANHAAAAEEV